MIHMLPRDTGSSPVRFSEEQGNRSGMASSCTDAFYHGCLLHPMFSYWVSPASFRRRVLHWRCHSFTRLLYLLILLLLHFFLQGSFFLYILETHPLVTLSAKSYVGVVLMLRSCFPIGFWSINKNVRGEPMAGRNEARILVSADRLRDAGEEKKFTMLQREKRWPVMWVLDARGALSIFIQTLLFQKPFKIYNRLENKEVSKDKQTNKHLGSPKELDQ